MLRPLPARRTRCAIMGRPVNPRFLKISNLRRRRDPRFVMNEFKRFRSGYARRKRWSPRARVALGFTLIEVVVALGILLAGLIAIASIFPATLQAGRQSELLTRAVGLAEQKAEEIRRDNDRQ